MSKLDQNRQKDLEPKRMLHAIKEIKKIGYRIFKVSNSELQIVHNRQLIRFFPYSGWHSGTSIKDGRGINKLLKQLKDN